LSGYQVESAHTGTEGLELALNGDFHAVILDVVLPGMDGFQLLKELRKHSNVPVLMLTSQDDVADKVIGLEMGADDYIPKMFSERELLARLRAAIRRYNILDTSEVSSSGVMDLGKLQVHHNSRETFLDGNPVDLTPIEYSLLVYLAKAKGNVITRDQLLDSVANRDYEVFDRSIDMHISSLRKKLGDDPKEPSFIKTVRGSGYMFISSTGK
jgi:two-component system response regulator CpxR